MSPFHSTNGIAYPEDIKRLREVFDRFCAENGLASGSAEADDLGKAIMSLFAAGVGEETALQDSLTEYLRRRTRLVPTSNRPDIISSRRN